MCAFHSLYNDGNWKPLKREEWLSELWYVHNGYPKSIGRKWVIEIYILSDRYLWYIDIRSDKNKITNIVLFLKQLLKEVYEQQRIWKGLPRMLLQIGRSKHEIFICLFKHCLMSDFKTTIVILYWKEWCWLVMKPNTWATWCAELAHWKRLWWKTGRQKEQRVTEDEMVR